MPSETIPRERPLVARSAAWLSVGLALVLAVGLVNPPARADGDVSDPPRPRRPLCSAGINTTGCNHYFIDRSGRQIGPGNDFFGGLTQVGDSEVTVRSGAVVVVRTLVGRDASTIRTTTLRTYKTTTVPSRSALATKHKLGGAAMNVVFSTARWAYAKYIRVPRLTGQTLYVNSAGRVVNGLTTNGHRIKVVSTTRVDLTTLRSVGGGSSHVNTTIRTNVGSDRRITVTPDSADLRARHGMSTRVADAIIGVVFAARHNGSDTFYVDRNGNWVAGAVAGGARVQIRFVDPVKDAVTYAVTAGGRTVVGRITGRLVSGGGDRVGPVVDRVARMLMRELTTGGGSGGGRGAATAVVPTIGPIAFAALLAVGGFVVGGITGYVGVTSNNPNERAAAFMLAGMYGLMLGLAAAAPGLGLGVGPATAGGFGLISGGAAGLSQGLAEKNSQQSTSNQGGSNDGDGGGGPGGDGGQSGEGGGNNENQEGGPGGFDVGLFKVGRELTR